MNIKRILSGVLAAAMLPAGAVFAEDVMPISQEAENVIIEESIGKYVEMIGTAKLYEDGLYILDIGEIAETKLNIDENTIFVDENGYKTALEGLKDGQSIKAIASSQMTMSIPPQTYAYAILAADAEGYFPFFAEVKSVEALEDGTIMIHSIDGDYSFVYSAEETVIEPFATRNIVTIDDIKEGSRILVKSHIMTMSIPAIVPAERISVLPELVIAPEETEETATVPANVLINGSEIDVYELAARILERDGAYLLPVRAICEAAGLSVSWDGTLKAITVGTTPMGVTFNIGENKYTKARMMPQELSSAPVLENDTTYVPVDFFTEILEAEASIEGDTLNVTIK